MSFAAVDDDADDDVDDDDSRDFGDDHDPDWHDDDGDAGHWQVNAQKAMTLNRV